MKDISMKVKGKTIIIGKSKTKVKNIKMVKLHKEDDRLDFYIEFIQKALDIPALHEIACGNNIPILRSSRIIKAWILNCYPKEKKKNEYHVRGVRLLTKVGNYLYKDVNGNHVEVYAVISYPGDLYYKYFEKNVPSPRTNDEGPS